jgi:hypothetical protein
VYSYIISNYYSRIELSTFWFDRSIITSIPHYETFSLIKNNILHQSTNYKKHFENSNFWCMSPLGHVGHVTYSFINMLFISSGIFDDRCLSFCPFFLLAIVLSVVLRYTDSDCPFRIFKLFLIKVHVFPFE